MCHDFECVHDQCGICSYTDADCEYEDCEMWEDCMECIECGGCCHDCGQRIGRKDHVENKD